MKLQRQSKRKARTHQLIQAGDLLQKSALLDVFHITPGDDLQAYEHREKAEALLGFFIECLEKNEFHEVNLKRWEKVGKRYLTQIKL